MLKGGIEKKSPVLEPEITSRFHDAALTKDYGLVASLEREHHTGPFFQRNVQLFHTLGTQTDERGNDQPFSFSATLVFSQVKPSPVRPKWP